MPPVLPLIVLMFVCGCVFEWAIHNNKPALRQVSGITMLAASLLLIVAAFIPGAGHAS